ncbi:MAG: glycosyltransferase family 87 protein [Ferruginibacter sp.]
MLRTRLNRLLILNMFVLAGIFTHSVCRDIELEKQYTGDLRNRVVGSRLQADGIPPYFYKWHTGEGFRYFDPQNNDGYKVSNITASPFFHDLLMPLSNLPQSVISKIWFWLQYLLLLLMVILSMRCVEGYLQKAAVINVAVLFTCTQAWKSNIAAGQIYFFMAFLIGCTFCGLLQKKRKAGFVSAGLSTALLVLIKPTALVIIVPFIFRYSKYKTYIITAVIMLAVYGLFALVNTKENSYWRSYAEALKEQVNIHRATNPSLQKNDALPNPESLEGINFIESKNNALLHPVNMHSENGNIFVLFAMLFKKNISASALFFLFSACVMLLMIFFARRYHQHEAGVLPTLILAFVFYMLSEIFAPVHRHQYSGVQWLPILTGAILFVKRRFSLPVFLIVAGLVLNIFSAGFIPMRHTIGEFCWILGLILMIFEKKSENKWKQQLSWGRALQA